MFVGVHVVDEAGIEPLRFVDSTSLSDEERVGYTTFASFRATVIFPYAVSQFWFYELYAMGVPLFLPSRDTLALFVNQDYTTCSDFDGYRPGYDPNSSHPYSPFASSDWHAM
eukprot:1838368-Amphidinium_carterae.1